MRGERPPRHEQERSADWSALLDEALTMPGRMSDTYSRFYNYSFFNQVLLWQQGVTEPVNTFKRWQDMGRQVKRGSKARSILRPQMRLIEDKNTGEQVRRPVGFYMVNCLFPVSDTEGEELPPYEPLNWNPEAALHKLNIREEPFDEINGNVQGLSWGRSFAVNPVAKYPLKTLMHELSHIQLGHTSEAPEDEHRGIKEFQAEVSAYLLMKELGREEDFDSAESRGYIQGWLKGERPSDEQIKKVFTSVDSILRAGRIDND